MYEIDKKKLDACIYDLSSYLGSRVNILSHSRKSNTNFTNIRGNLCFLWRICLHFCQAKTPNLL